MQKFFATCPKGLENLLFRELSALGASSVKETVSGVSFSGDMELGMRVCLYSRFASRIILNLNTFKCEDDTDLYMGAQGIGYEKYFDSDRTIAVTFNGTSSAIRNTQYGALRIKDAVCDRFVACGMERPDVERHNPDVHIIATLKKGELAVGIDLSGTAQFWREYNRSTGAAPLKENLAAAMVARSGFDGSQNFVDPMCGSATLLLEAATLATDTAPGLMRTSYGFKKLKDYDEACWQKIHEEASERARKGREAAAARGIRMFGFDADPYVIKRAEENIAQAGFSDLITVEHRPLDNLINPCSGVNELPCVVVTNPPYGERMGNFNELILLYTNLGHRLKTLFKGGIAAVISTSPELLSCLRLTVDRSYRLFNGALECQLRVFKLDRQAEGDESAAQGAAAAGAAGAAGTASGAAVGEAEVAVDFANRLTRNMKHLDKWAAREQISAYRVYDADLPEYNAAIDRYNQYYIIQEYQAPATVKAHVAQKRLLDMIAATIRVTGAAGENVIVKSREKQKGESQYARREDALGHFITVYEDDVAFSVNLHDYLDTGLFLDARPLRRLIRKLAAGKSFLNLFAYTCSASVAAALGGAVRTTSVDMSRTYLDWGRENFKLNGMDLDAPGGFSVPAVAAAAAAAALGEDAEPVHPEHHFMQADCLAWLSADQGQRYDLIYIDPPTFSNSKRMEKSFDVQRDHKLMLGNLTRHLNDGGTVIFCTNRRNFKLDDGLEEYGFTVSNITSKSFDPDFKRDEQLHTCFRLIWNKEAQTKEPEALVTNTMRPKWSRDLEVRSERFTWSGERAARREDEGRSRSDRTFERDRARTRYSNDDRRYDRDGSRYDRDERDSRYDRDERSSYSRDERRGGGGYGRDGRRGGGYDRDDRRSGGYDRDDRRGGYGRGNGGGGSREREGAGRAGRPGSTGRRPARVWGPQGLKEL